LNYKTITFVLNRMKWVGRVIIHLSCFRLCLPTIRYRYFIRVLYSHRNQFCICKMYHWKTELYRNVCLLQVLVDSCWRDAYISFKFW